MTVFQRFADGRKVNPRRKPTSKANAAKDGTETKKSQAKRWYFDFTVDGKRYREAIPAATSKQDAQLVEAKARHDVFNGTYSKRVGQMAFAEFAQGEYMEWSKRNKKSHGFDVTYGKVLCVFVDLEDHDFDFVAQRHHLAGGDVLVRPVHL